MQVDDDVTVVTCPACGPVPVLVSTVEVHQDASDGVRFYLVGCSACGELVTGGCPATIDALLRRGVVRRTLHCTTDAGDAELSAFRSWLDTDPDFASSG